MSTFVTDGQWLVERLLPIPEVRGSNPVNGKTLYWIFVCCQLYWKVKNKEKEAGNGPFFKKKSVLSRCLRIKIIKCSMNLFNVNGLKNLLTLFSGHSFSLFSIVTKMFFIKMADGWIRTWVLWCRKWPPCQLYHNHIKCLILKNGNLYNFLISRLWVFGFLFLFTVGGLTGCPFSSKLNSSKL